MPPARRAVRVLALAICLVLVSGVLAARGLEGGSRTTVVAAGGGAPDVPVAAQLGSSVIVDPLPSLPATTAAPPPTPTTRPARPALTVPALPVTVPRLPLPTTAPFPQVPPELEGPGYPGQSEWTAVSGGIHLHLTISPARPRAGDVVHFTAEATSAAFPCCGMALLFGDGYQVAQDMSWSCPGGGPRSAGTARLETTHVYNGDGRR
ncbi:MAG TPA: hypothetical protein VFO65_06625, partial [Acidimicrobiales bacterium]|nr:hypothetical protein [Acidimicrobiales bacterium]